MKHRGVRRLRTLIVVAVLVFVPRLVLDRLFGTSSSNDSTIALAESLEDSVSIQRLENATDAVVSDLLSGARAVDVDPAEANAAIDRMIARIDKLAASADEMAALIAADWGQDQLTRLADYSADVLLADGEANSPYEQLLRYSSLHSLAVAAAAQVARERGLSRWEIEHMLRGRPRLQALMASDPDRHWGSGEHIQSLLQDDRGSYRREAVSAYFASQFARIREDAVARAAKTEDLQ